MYDLSERVFGVPMKDSVVHQAMRAQLGNARKVIAHTKDRSEVSGGGKKPWRQKGTGRARHGSIRSPLWTGGGVTFGPRNDRNFSLKINKKQKNKALAMVLSSKVKTGTMAMLDALTLENHKTKHMADMFQAFTAVLPEVATRKTLVITAGTDKNIVLASRNLPHVKVVRADSLNVHDLLTYRYVLIPKEAVETIEKIYGGVKKVTHTKEAKEEKRVAAQKAVRTIPVKKATKKAKKTTEKKVVKKVVKKTKKKA